ncbi:hypothetical protein ACI784_15945 [Geodermatophilus sp. SYSU D01186]
MTLAVALGRPSAFGRRSSLGRTFRALERELADYATVADRDELAALLDGRGAGESLAADILSRQAQRDLFRAS